MKSTKAIRKELAKLIKTRKVYCVTSQEKNVLVEECRREINRKYGHDWRSRDDFKPYPADKYNTNYKSPSVYDGHTHGEHWID